MLVTGSKTRSFYQTVRNEFGARDAWRRSLTRLLDALGRETLGSILTGQRNDITRSIGDEVNESVASLGIQIIDVRLRRRITQKPPARTFLTE